MVWTDHIIKEYQEYTTVSKNGHGATADQSMELEVSICLSH